MKEVIAIVVALSMMLIPATAFASDSPAKKDISKATIKVTSTTRTFDDKAHAAVHTVYYNGVKLVKDKDYTLSCKGYKNAGTYTAKAVITGIGKFKGTASKSYKYTIKKANQTPIKFSRTTITETEKVLKKKTRGFGMKYTPDKIGSEPTGKVTVKKVSGSSRLYLNSRGSVKVKRYTKKGTYKITIKATAASTKNYLSGSTTKTITVKVK